MRAGSKDQILIEEGAASTATTRADADAPPPQKPVRSASKNSARTQDAQARNGESADSQSDSEESRSASLPSEPPPAVPIKKSNADNATEGNAMRPPSPEAQQRSNSSASDNTTSDSEDIDADPSMNGASTTSSTLATNGEPVRADDLSSGVVGGAETMADAKEPAVQAATETESPIFYSIADFSKRSSLFNSAPRYSAASILDEAEAFASDPGTFDGTYDADFKNFELTLAQRSIRGDMPAKSLFLLELARLVKGAGVTATNVNEAVSEESSEKMEKACKKINADKDDLVTLIARMSRGCREAPIYNNIKKPLTTNQTYTEGSTAWFLSKACEAYQKAEELVNDHRVDVL